MAINIHFFSKSNNPIDYTKLLEYFDEHPEFHVYYANDYVECQCKDPYFDYEYRYLITKQSRVSKIADLNPEYINTNFLLEMPVLIPSFLAKEILTGAQKISKAFGLDVYHDSFDDIKTFNVVDMLSLFDMMRKEYIDLYGLQGKILFDNEKLNVVFKYQRSIDAIKEGYKGDLKVNNIFPIVNHVDNVTGMAYRFQLGDSVVIPPYVDYLFIETESGTYLVKRDSFDRAFSRYLEKEDSYLPDLYLIRGRNARQFRKEGRKIQKICIDSSNFIPLHLSDVIEG